VISDDSPSSHPAATAAPPSTSYVGRVVVALAIVALAALAVVLRTVLVLVFGSIVVAVAVRAGGNGLRRLTGWSERLALSVVVLGTLAVLVIGVWLLGEPVGEQFAELRNALPAAWGAITRWLNSHAMGLWLLRWWDGANANFEWTSLAGVAGSAVGALGAVFLMLVTGLYLAADPNQYRRGLLHLLPQRHRARVDLALCEAGNGLSRWLLGQAVAMLVVGAMTGIGLVLIGMPLALPLAIIAGVLEFVPFFGPVLTGALVVLLAFTQSPTHALYAAGVCFFVQHFEGYVIQPFVQRWAIALPPALGLVAVIVFAALFGALGAVFAMPLMVVLMILVQRLYLDGALGEGAWPVVHGNLNCRVQREPTAVVPHAAGAPHRPAESFDE
jgi:predicted PurR-regulated permease PerM